MGTNLLGVFQATGLGQLMENETLVCANSPDSAYFFKINYTPGDEDRYNPELNDCDHASEMCWILN